MAETTSMSPPNGPGEGPAGAPSVSVIVPTRDRPDRLRTAVEAIHAQRYPGHVECVVAFDRTAEVEFDTPTGAGRSIVTLSSRNTPGPAGARNAGAEAAGGELLAFCDDDDVWRPEKLRLQVGALSDGDVSAVTCGIEVSYRGRSVERMPPRDRITEAELIRSRDATIHTSSLLVRRDDFFDRIGPFDESMPQGYGEDYEWLLRAASWRPLGCVRAPLVSVQWHESSWFDGKWDLIIDAIHRLLELHPEIRKDPIGLGRLFGRLAFAHASAGRRREALRWCRRTFDLNPREKRVYLAAAVAFGLPSKAALGLAHSAGKGI